MAFPTLAAILSRTVDIEDDILTSAFFEMVSTVKANLLNKALSLHIGNMENFELRQFVHYVTGSSVCAPEGIQVCIN